MQFPPPQAPLPSPLRARWRQDLHRESRFQVHRPSLNRHPNPMERMIYSVHRISLVYIDLRLLNVEKLT